MKEYLNGRLKVIQGDITTLKVDAIVNAANSTLMGGGGVDGAIHREGGPSILTACKEIRNHRYRDGLPPGKAVITDAGKLPADYVIHTVGPVWGGGRQDEVKILEAAYRNTLLLAEETGINTIAFPAISTGVYGFPKELAAPIVYNVIKTHLSRKSLPRKVFLIFLSKKNMEIFEETLSVKEL
ncbi:MAG: O-acetyl-ADP-ribose deacetylase [Spirochaetales bacterium]|nr:O-acetyl-ADP-ribose deacetylase [Spirochaetales bacterium]